MRAVRRRGIAANEGRSEGRPDQTSVLYVAPWVDLGGTDKGTIDWFRSLDRNRFSASLITTQISANRRLAEVVPYASEVWCLPDLLGGADFPRFILDFIVQRRIEVVHVMNSRLGFQLLPDIKVLDAPPATVVQLHVEEDDRSGYCRYVATRYGNLVDCFSLTSHQLAEALERYGVTDFRRRVIYTGVDAEGEFDPAQVDPVDLGEGDFHVLWMGRFVDQKDPVLAIEVAARLCRQVPGARLHMVGEGGLAQEVESAIDERGLGETVRLHGPTLNPAAWYAASDAVLMTSRFEGIPYVLFESMAMQRPVVAPALAGNAELIGPEEGVLIEPRDDVAAYAAALARLAEDRDAAVAMGRAGRAVVAERYTLKAMADGHMDLYDELLERQLARRAEREVAL